MANQKTFCIMCGEELEAGALFCSSCGAKQEESSQSQAKNSERQIEAFQHSMIQNNQIPNNVTGEQQFCCPQCHSENVQSFEIIYNQNLSTSNHTTAGVGMTLGGKLGGGVAKTTGTSVTALGETVAPPAKAAADKFGCGTVIIVILATTALQLLLYFISPTLSEKAGILWIPACIFIYIQRKNKQKEAEKWNQEVWPKLYDEWRHSYMCMKCGHRFIH